MNYYKVDPLPYRYGDLEPFIDEKTMRIHHDKHHEGYAKKLNDAISSWDSFPKVPISKLLSEIERIPSDIRTSVVNNGGGHAHHALFWVMMAPNSGVPEDGKFIDELNKTFGNIDDFENKFTEAALKQFGSGWAWLVVSSDKKLEIVKTSNQDSPYSEGLAPILGIDVWEHAYYLNYQNKRDEYIKAWWNVVNWEKVEELYERSVK